MTAADPFTRASATWIAAQRGSGRTGSAFEWTGSGSFFRNPFKRQQEGGASAPLSGSPQPQKAHDHGC